VLVQPASSDEQVTRGGLIVPDTAKERPQEGTVVAVGPGKVGDDGKRQAMEVAVGDTVLYAKYAGTEIKADNNNDKDLLVLREDDILAVIKSGPAATASKKK
jgi:chaperonin GroES